MAATESRSLELRAVALTLWSLAATAITLRAYVRLGMMKSLAIDDYIMIVAMLAYTANTTTCVIGTVYGSGRHMADLDPEDALIAMKFWWACYPSYAVAMIASKFSVGFFLLRITTQKVHRWIIYIAMALTFASGTAFFFVAVFQCVPVSMAWGVPSETGSCLSVDAIIGVTGGYSAINIITDFTFTLLPAWLVWHLQMDKKTKAVIIPILSMACIASCAVCVRLAYLSQFRNPDFLWVTTDIAIWSQTEQGLAIAAGSFATLRPLFRVLLRKVGLSSGGESGAPSGGRGYNGGYNGNNYKMTDASYCSQCGHNGGSRGGSRAMDRTVDSGRSKGGGPKSLWSLTTFNRMDEDDEKHETESMADLAPSPVSSNGNNDRTSNEDNDLGKGDYRVKIVSKKDGTFRAPPVAAHTYHCPRQHRRGSEQQLQIHCTREFGSNAV